MERAADVEGSDIEDIESVLIRLYIAKFCELPPGNRSMAKNYLKFLEE